MTSVSAAAPSAQYRLVKSVVAVAVVGIVLVDCVLAGYVVFRRSEDLERRLRASENLARNLEEHAARSVGAIDQLLIGLGEQLRAGSAGSSAPALETLRRQLSRTAGVTAIHAVFPDLRTIDLAKSGRGAALPFSPRDLLARHDRDPRPGLAISALSFDRNAGLATVALGRSIELAGGVNQGIVVAVLDLDYFLQYYDSARLGPSDVIELYGRDGTRLARNSTDGKSSERDYMNHAMALQLSAGRAVASFRVASSPDGPDRYQSYRAVPETPLAVVVSFSVDAALADSRRRMALSSGLAGLATVLLLLGAIVLLRQARSHARMAESLIDSEARFRAFATMSSDWLWEQDAEMRFTFISEGGARFSAAGSRLPIGKTRRESGVFGLSEDQWSAHEADLAARRSFVLECLRHDATGRARNCRVVGEPVYDRAGTFAGYRGTGTDITDEIAAKAAISERNRFLRQIVDALPARVTVKDRDLRYVLVNRQHAEYLGATEEEIIGGRIESMPIPAYHGDNLAAYKARVTEMDREVLASRRPALAREFRISARDGRIATVLTSKIPLVDAKGEVDVILTVVVDLSDLKALEAEILRQRELLAAIINAVPDRISLKDRDLNFVLANPAQAAMFGLEPKDLIGRRLGDFLPLCYQPGAVVEATKRVDISDRAIIETGIPELHREWIWRHRDGTDRADIVSKLPIGGPDGRPSGVLTIAIDITERMRAERALAEAKDQAEVANRSKSDFLANMSHELRTPLNAIIGFAEIVMADGASLTARQSEYVGDIFDSGHHLLEIINDILDLSRIEATQLELRETTVDLDRLLLSCKALIAGRAEASGVDLRLARDGAPPLRADALRLKQIVVNLLSNAVKFTPRGGSVSLRCDRRADGQVEIAVADTGIGMSAADIEHALKPFGQVANVLTKSHDGVGLGLPLTRSLVELHGGRLEIESEPGRGTTARAIFPAWRADVGAGARSLAGGGVA